MRYNIICQLICILSMLSCASPSIVGDNSSVAISVNAFSENNDILRIDSMLVNVDSATLVIPDTIISYTAEDACILDENIYILDQSNNIIVFDLATNNFVKKINATGRGHGEYAKPIAITSDKKNIYVLDMTGLAILSYNKNLDFVEKIKISYPCLDFVKIDSGFLLYNLNSDNEVGKIIVTNDRGEKTNDFLKATACVEKSLPTKHIFQKNNNEVCIIDPYTNDIYKYAYDSFDQLASLEFSEDNKNSVNPMSAFLIKNKIISQYWSKFVMTSIFDTISETSVSGLAKISKSQYGFLPIIQQKEILYGLYPDMDEGVAYHLFKYHFRE